MAEKAVTLKARQYAIMQSFVGTISPDGHEILEYYGYQQSSSKMAKGWLRNAIYRYRCAIYGNDKGVSVGLHLKTKAKITS